MLTIPSNIKTLIDTGRFSIRWMVRFNLDSGAHGIWNDTFPITYEGVVYDPLAGNISFDSIPGSASLSADKVTVKVTNILSAVTTVIAGEDWHQRPATLYMAILDDAGNVQHVIPRFVGFADTIEISDAADDLVQVSISIESNNRELNRASGRTRSDADQRRVSATDGFFKHTASSNTDTNIYWGRKGAQEPKRKRFLGLF